MGFERLLDKREIPICPIMGVNVAAINMQWLIHYTQKNIKKLSGDYMCVSNVHTTVMAYEDAYYKSVQNNGIMAIPDGGPLASVGRKHGYKNMHRTTGPSYLENVLKLSQKKGYRHFFYGSSEKTLSRLKAVIEDKYPGAIICGMISPPFRELTMEEDQEFTQRINDANADFIWIGLGAPKQEIWMAEHQGKVKGFMVGVGAGFDYLAGNIKRAPKWMQEHNLEWLFRLVQEPKRLFKRYLVTNTKFIWHAMVRGR